LRARGGICFYVGLAVWQMMKQSPGCFRKAARAKLDQVEPVNEE